MLAFFLLIPAAALSGQWENLFNGKDLNGWEVRGEGIWTVMKDGTLLGQHAQPNPTNPFSGWPVTEQQYRSWLYRQAWLYTVREFGEFDLHVEYWLPPSGNSGISIRDTSRAHYAIGEPDTARVVSTTLKGTPAHIGYEIQIIDAETGKYPSGSIFLFSAAPKAIQKRADWNGLDIESRNDRIRVRLNGEPVAESAGDPDRSKTGPIGLQLHGQFSFAMYRNIRIREIKR
jgi:hypothetical protein